jgi:putative transposase
LGCYIGPANENDRQGIKTVLEKIKLQYNEIHKIYADMGYQGINLKNQIKQDYNIELEIVKRPRKWFWVHKDTPIEQLPHIEEFTILPKRWIVERTLAWINRNRGLSKDYEFNTENSENLVYLAIDRLILRRLYK